MTSEAILSAPRLGDLSPIALLLVDQRRKVVEVNAAAESLLQSSRRGLRGKPLSEIVYHDSPVFELLDADEGSDVSLTPVMVVDGDTVLATPEELSGASVTGRIVGTAKGPKINGFTYKRRTNNRRRYGHRQQYHVVEITSITR